MTNAAVQNNIETARRGKALNIVFMDTSNSRSGDVFDGGREQTCRQ